MDHIQYINIGPVSVVCLWSHIYYRGGLYCTGCLGNPLTWIDSNTESCIVLLQIQHRQAWTYSSVYCTIQYNFACWQPQVAVRLLLKNPLLPRNPCMMRSVNYSKCWTGWAVLGKSTEFIPTVHVDVWRGLPISDHTHSFNSVIPTGSDWWEWDALTALWFISAT